MESDSNCLFGDPLKVLCSSTEAYFLAQKKTFSVMRETISEQQEHLTA